jgi:tetratricopeptide (TPR) repeat protein
MIVSTSNLSELHLTLGDIAEAVAMGEAGIAHADRSERRSQRLINLTTWADALHQSGEPARAEALFEEAEALQAKLTPDQPQLYSLQGYQYWDLLLAQGNPSEVRERAAYALDFELRASFPLLTIALTHLSLGRAALALGEQNEAKTQLDEAVDGLRHASTMDCLPLGPLSRAALFRETGDVAAARRDLDEAMRIAKRSEMRLFQCDAHLEYARLALAEGDKERARKHVGEARRLVEETGYGRRRPEVEELEAQVR